jgi:hypothetical protein
MLGGGGGVVECAGCEYFFEVLGFRRGWRMMRWYSFVGTYGSTVEMPWKAVGVSR